MAPIPKPSKPPHVNSDPGLSKNNAPDNIRAIASNHNDENLISFDLISLEDNDSWEPTPTVSIPDERASGYMQDMWTLEENANAVFNMIVEVTRKGMAKEKQHRAVLMDSLASGVIPDGRGISSSVYASDEKPVTKELINKYWKTQGPSFRKGLEHDSIRLILEGAAAEIVRLDAPTSSDLGQQDVSGNVSEDDQPNPEEGLKQTKQVMPGNVSGGAQLKNEEVFKPTEQADSVDDVTGEPQSVTEPAENVSGIKEAAEALKKPEVTFLQYGASELLQLRGRALAVDKSAFPDEIRPFVIKDTKELLRKPKVMKVAGGIADSKWASPSKTSDENVAPSKINAFPSKVNSVPRKVNLDPSKANFVPSNIDAAPSKIDAATSNITRYDSTGSDVSNFLEKTQPTKAMNGLAASKWADQPKASDTYTPLDFVSDISSTSVPARPQRSGLNDSMWADSSPSKGSLTRPSINREVVDRVINPQLTHSNKERRKKSIHIITEATKRRTAVLEKATAEKEAALANYSTINID